MCVGVALSACVVKSCIRSAQVPENPPNYYRQMSKVLHSSGRGLLQSVIGLVSSQVHHSIWTACHSLDMGIRDWGWERTQGYTRSGD